MISPFFHHYLVWVGQRAQALGAKRIYFLSREGLWLSGQYERLRSRTKRPDDYPLGCHLAVSRLSTYLPSFSSVEDAKSSYRRGQYRMSSDAAMLSSLGYEGDGDAAQWLEERRKAQRQALNVYLDQNGVTKDGTAFVADIGWRGSIQDNLARLHPEITWRGLYFHLQPFIVDQAANVSKEEFLLPSEIRNDKLLRRLRFTAPLEFLLAHHSGAVLGYDLAGGSATPEIEQGNDLFGAAIWERLLQLRGEMELAAIDFSLDDTADCDAALNATLALLERPSSRVYELYFAARRDERFGSGRFLDIERISTTELMLSIFNGKTRRSVAERLAISGWPWAMLQRDTPIFAPLLRRALLGLDLSLVKPGQHT